jgi:hypothetical protein
VFVHHNGNDYRAKAAELTGRVTPATTAAARLEMEKLVRGYLRLADQADRNDLTDVVYVTPSKDN